jgi:hypothetical protein
VLLEIEDPAIVLEPREQIPNPSQNISYPVIIFVVLLGKDKEDSDAAPYRGKRKSGYIRIDIEGLAIVLESCD